MKTMEKMNKLFLGLAAFSVFMFASCAKESDILSDGPGENPAAPEVTFTATFEENASSSSAPSRTAVSDGNVTWSAGDAISVLNSEGGFDAFTLSDGAGTANAKFTGSFTSADGRGGNIAVYPAGNHTYDGTNLTVTLPSVYGNADTEYTSNANVLMLAYKTDDSNELHFKHLGAGIRLVINVPAGATSVSLTGKGICGDFTVDPAATDAQITQSAQDQTVTYEFKAFAEQREETFYFPLPTGAYDKFVIKVNADQLFAVKTLDFKTPKEFARKSMRQLPKLDNIVIENPWIDFGLPSGTLWYKVNLGAATETEVGYYFAWGETEPKTSFYWSNYKYGIYDSGNSPDMGMTKYNVTDGKTTLEASDDAATVLLGSDCRIPTQTELDELLGHTTQSHTTHNGVQGVLFTGIGEYTDVTLFLPASGYKINETGGGYSSYGSMWTSSLLVDKERGRYAKAWLKGSWMTLEMNADRYFGLPIRPVRASTSN